MLAVFNPVDRSLRLGKELFRCRLVPVMQWVGTGPGGAVFAYCLLPLVYLPIASLAAGVGAVTALGVEAQPAARITLLATASVVYLTGIYLCYILPARDYLVVHELGFVVKVTLEAKAVAYSEIDYISFGLEGRLHRALDQVNGVLGVVRPGDAKALAEVSRSALNVHKKDRSRVVIKQFALRFELADLESFLEFLFEHHPEVLRPVDSVARSRVE